MLIYRGDFSAKIKPPNCLSGAEKWEVKQARKALAAEKKAEKEAKGDDADEE